jgi:hypothetical protein
MNRNYMKKKVFLISTKDVETLFDNNNLPKCLFNNSNVSKHRIIDIWNKVNDRLTLYDFYNNINNNSLSYYQNYENYLKGNSENRSASEDNISRIKEIICDNIKGNDDSSSKYFYEIFQLGFPEDKYIFLTRCFPNKLIKNGLESKKKVNINGIELVNEVVKPGILTNIYWLVCYVNTVMSIIDDPNLENYEFYGLLHNGDVDGDNNKSITYGKQYQLSSYDNSVIKFEKIFTYSHEPDNIIYKNIIMREDLFNELDNNKEACDYLLEKLIENKYDTIINKSNLLKNINTELSYDNLTDEDKRFIFDCESCNIQHEYDEFVKYLTRFNIANDFYKL